MSEQGAMERRIAELVSQVETLTYQVACIWVASNWEGYAKKIKPEISKLAPKPPRHSEASKSTELEKLTKKVNLMWDAGRWERYAIDKGIDLTGLVSNPISEPSKSTESDSHAESLPAQGPNMAETEGSTEPIAFHVTRRHGSASQNPDTKAARTTVMSMDPTQVDSDVAGSEPVTPYHYSPLDAKMSEIRVLTFQETVDESEPIRCTLSSHSLDDRASLSTLVPLSYTWGTMARSETITIDGHPFSVTRNLFVALKHFRSLGQGSIDPRAFGMMRMKYKDRRPQWWIDAICINQDDLDERSSQVGLMTRLYRSAHVVHVWLGEERDDSRRAMNIIRKLNTEPKTLQWTKQPGKSYQRQGPGMLTQQLPEDPTALEDTEKDQNYEALLRLLGRDWFSRVWIRQEVALPSTVKFHCGDEQCSWEELMSVVSILSYLANNYYVKSLHRSSMVVSSALTSCFEKVEGLRHLRSGIAQVRGNDDPYLPLRAAIFHARGSASTDPRDKIYAMLPLVNPDKTQIIADYRRPYEEVAKAVALDLAEHSLNFLSACQYSSVHQNPRLPSWAPDFSRDWDFHPLLLTFDMDSIYSETYDFRAEPPEISYEAERSVLRAKGYIFDEMLLLNDAYASGTVSNARLAELREEWFGFYHKTRKPDAEKYTPKQHPYDYRYFSHVNIELWDWYFDFNVQGQLDKMRPNMPGSQRHGRPYTKSMYELREVNQKGNPTMRVFEHFLMTEPFGDQLGNREDIGAVRNLFAGRKFGRTSQGAFGLFPAAARLGDRICQFKGSVLSYVIRESEDRPDRWIMVGDVWFIWGVRFMGGESEPPLRDIALI